jgi:large subunit ribosomal protein L17
MNHRKNNKKLGRTSAHRKALFRNMVTSLLDHEQIRTTDAKAKELRGVAERMITLGKKGTLHARRRALRTIRSKEVTSKVFDELASRYRERPGGYTRVIRLGQRPGDAAPMAIIELVDRGDVAKESPGENA